MIRIQDMVKIECPFVREMVNGKYIITDKIADGYKWVFTDETVLAVEKMHGTNVSLVIENGAIKSVWNRTAIIPFFNRGKQHIIQGVMEAFDRGYIDELLTEDGQYFGELIGERVNGNPYNIEGHVWLPFKTWMQDHLKYKCWGKYPKTYASISQWFEKDLQPLYSWRTHGQKWDKPHFVEGIVFTHPDGRMAKLRRDMFPFYNKVFGNL